MGTKEKVARIYMLQLEIKDLEEEVKQLKSELPYKELGVYEEGDLKVTLSPNRRFNAGMVEDALKRKVITKKQYESILVSKPDGTLAKKHLTGLQLEQCMKEYEPRILVGENK